MELLQDRLGSYGGRFNAVDIHVLFAWLYNIPELEQKSIATNRLLMFVILSIIVDKVDSEADIRDPNVANVLILLLMFASVNPTRIVRAES